MKCTAMTQLWAVGVAAGLGALLAILGGLTAALWPALFQHILNNELQLSADSTSFRMWRDTPVPMYIQFYFFNWTNPEEIEDKNIKPRFTEMGPYRFNEFHEKVNVTFHPENGTVSFRQVRRWVFDPEHSSGDLDDQITTLNVPPLTAAFVARDWSIFSQTPLSLMISRIETRHVTKQAREFLFDGYDDPLVTLADTLPVLAQIDIPFDKFGWFYKRNNSDEYDGHFNMDSGEDDISKVGRLRYWNYGNQTRFFPSYCGRVNGSAGELWPPGQDKTNISMFSPDLCRSLTLNYSEEVQLHGVSGYRYSGGREIVDNGTLNADNTCFCGGECLPVGVVNASSCRLGAPAFVSYPHFYLADPVYSSLVEGMHPQQDKHRFYVTLEPTTGIPLDVAARFQINILLDRRPYISMYRRVPRVFFPIIWFEQRASMTPSLARQLALLLALPDVMTWLSAAGLALGAVLLLTAASLLLRKTLAPRNRVEKKNSTEAPLMKQATELRAAVPSGAASDKITCNGHDHEGVTIA